ncbi:MAG: TRAP transporter substrate-binding protein [Eubacteriales bacterium]|nr:TRAP transporter substrate-binding protein [Eubacteriales bacterium]
MRRRKYLLSGIVVLAALGLAACGGHGAAENSGDGGTAAASEDGSLNLTMAMVDNSQSNYYRGAKRIADLVSEATDGKIQITIQSGGVLGGETDTLDMVIQGDLDMTSCANAVLANYIPEMAVLDQAFLWDSVDQANYAVQNELGALIEAEAEKQGIHVLGYLESGFRDVFSKKPIQSLDDFKGVKIRVMQNEGQLAAFTAFGANPVAISAAEQFTALQQGTIDACENAVSNCWINKYYEAGVTSVTNTKHCFVYIPVCMSGNAWNKIPEDMREAFAEAVQKGCMDQWTYLNEANAEAAENLKNAGVAFYDIDTEALKKAYRTAQEKAGTSYDEAWEAAIDAAKAAVQ